MPNEWNDWNVSTIAKLRRLWLAKNADGSYVHSSAEVGQILGVSKNAAVGKAHRMGLPGRPSPIQHDGRKPKPERKPRAPKATLPPVPSVESAPEVAEDPSPPPPPPKPYGRIVTCCWPIGEPGRKSFRSCDAPSEPGRPYCPDHARLAYVRVRDRREDAA